MWYFLGQFCKCMYMASAQRIIHNSSPVKLSWMQKNDTLVYEYTGFKFFDS